MANSKDWPAMFKCPACEQVEFLGCVGGGREVLRHIRKTSNLKLTDLDLTNLLSHAYVQMFKSPNGKGYESRQALVPVYYKHMISCAKKHSEKRGAIIKVRGCYSTVAHFSTPFPLWSCPILLFFLDAPTRTNFILHLTALLNPGHLISRTSRAPLKNMAWTANQPTKRSKQLRTWRKVKRRMIRRG